MKKLVLLLITIALVSCGKEKKNVEIKEEKELNNYTLTIEAIYPKDDSISVVYMTGNYFQYEKAISLKIKGSASLQQLPITIPQDIIIENVQITLSTNKDQNKITLKNLSVFNNKSEIFNGSNFTYSEYFDFNPGVSWDIKDKSFDLNFDGKFPPGMTGNNSLIAKLSK